MRARLNWQAGKTLVTLQAATRDVFDQLAALWLSRKTEIAAVETREMSSPGSFQFRLTPTKRGQSLDRVVLRDCRSVGIEDAS